MRSARLDMALESRAFVLPTVGDIAVLAPRIGDDLSALPKDRVVVLTRFKPDHAYFEAQGYRMDTKAAGAAIVCLPRAKALALDLIAQAFGMMHPGAPVMVDGQKTDGIDAILKLARAEGMTPGDVVSKAHGKAFVLPACAAPKGWAAVASQIEGGFFTRPGVFSADGPDRGSALLAAALPEKLKGHFADLGAGWGYLSRAILAHEGVKSLDLVEADLTALECARLNITDPRAAFHWADVAAFKGARLWDGVVMNPPFHTSRDADPELGLAFLRAAHRGLAPSGSLWLVANRHLPYDRLLTDLFKSVEDLGGDAAFRLTRAAYPVRTR